MCVEALTKVVSQEASSKATTPFTPSPCHHDPNSVTSIPVKFSKSDVEMDITEIKNSQKPLKRKAGKTQRHNQSGYRIL